MEGRILSGRALGSRVAPPSIDCDVLAATIAQSNHALDHDVRLERVRRHLLSNLSQPLRLVTAARIAGLEPHYFSGLFHSKVGIRFSEWQLRCRMSHAAKLLASRRLSVTAAAVMTGYRDITAFGRAFRRVFSITPSRYVQSMRKGAGPPP